MQYVRNVYCCSYNDCKASFRSKTKYEIHERNHLRERPFICSFENCGKDFASQSHLTRHELTHAEPLRCPIEGCSELLKTKDTLRRHVSIVHEKKTSKKYKCTICDEQFNKHNWLQRHMFRHTKKYPHICPIEDCKKGFLFPNKLKRHLKTHEGYSCKHEGCGAILHKWSLYVKHLRESHPRENKCNVCNRVFAHSSNLKAHKVIHEEMRTVYPCEAPNCTRYYHHINNLKYHMKCYHEKRQFKCPKDMCFKAFKSQKDLDNHMEKHAPKKSRKKKTIKPTFAAKLAGCVKPKPVIRKCSSVPSLQNTAENSIPITDSESCIYQGSCKKQNVFDVAETKTNNELEFPENASDYEEITVNIKTAANYESDVSSCISESEGLMNCSSADRC